MDSLVDPPFVEFLESHRPGLEAGKYTVSIDQTTEIGQIQELMAKQFTFAVGGPQFSLDPQEIAAVFPPPGSPGDHQNAFPHIALKRGTLPWERTADTDGTTPSPDWSSAPAPWLALLMYDEEDEKAQKIRMATESAPGQALTLATIGKATDAGFPQLPTELPPTTLVSAVDVKTGSLDEFLPSAVGLRMLCHVRRNILFSQPKNGVLSLTALDSKAVQEALGIDLEGARLLSTGLDNCMRLTDAGGTRTFLVWENQPEPGGSTSPSWLFTDGEGGEYAFVMGHRLPGQGKTTTAHLISLEGWFTGGKLDPTAGGKNYCRFVSLYQWRFSCESHDHTFIELLKNLNGGPSQPSAATLRLPPGQNNPAEPELAAGLTLQPHQFRDGSRSFSWYRGPLAPGSTETGKLPPLALPADSPDSLLCYDPASGMFHAGYAAAWELGRMLCLGNSRVSQALYTWKSGMLRLQRQADPDTLKQLARLPVKPPGRPDDHPLPPVVAEWLASLRRLEPVPFRYLVPDERMLPVESIRFFQLDPLWLDCAVDGAFSIGRIHEEPPVAKFVNPAALGQMHGSNPVAVTGLLLRSAAVSGWPLLKVSGYSGSSPAGQLKLIRFERLTPDILLCLFEGIPESIEIFLPKETLHFGDPKPAQQLTAGFPRFDSNSRRFIFPLSAAGMMHPAAFAHSLLQPAPKVIFNL